MTGKLSQMLGGNFLGKAIKKIDPRFAGFFAGMKQAGYSTQQAIDYLRDQFMDESTRHLEEKERQGTLRPDEAALIASKERRQLPAKLIGKSAVAGAGFAGGLAGASAQEALGLISSKVLGKDQESQTQPESIASQKETPIPEKKISPLSRSQMIFDSFSKDFPNLARFIQKGMDQNKTLEDTAASMKSVKALEPEIMSAEKKLNMDLASILRYIFGGQNQSPEQQTQAPSPTRQQPSSPQRDALLQTLQQVKRMRGG